MSLDINYLKNRSKEIHEVINEIKRIVSKPFDDLSIDERYAIRYQIVVLAEALGSICLHIAIEDFSYEPSSYAECFKFLEDKGLINSEELIKIARLRNLVVHRYWNIDDLKIYESIKKDFKCVEELLKIIGKKYGV
ncbi:MAG: DUF86 domain-containing protein [Candidatus Thermoplasmatota archaeon]|nr:DUF86 domain-containing protein [Candidatus Thermoplasmatota archaeon]